MIWREQMTAHDPVHHRPTLSTNRGARPSPAANVDDAWAQLWFTLERHVWSTLAIVPADTGSNALDAARALVAAGQLYREGGVELLDATGATPEALDGILASIPELAAASKQVVIAVDSPLARPAAIAIARAADAALLTVPLGTSTRAAGQRTIEVIGREHFVGSVAVRGSLG